MSRTILRRTPEAFSNAYRGGMLLGLLLGDVRDPTQRVLQSGPAVQQTCLTVDALIRYEAWLGNDSGARDPMPEVSSAVLRWAAMQGLVNVRTCSAGGSVGSRCSMRRAARIDPASRRSPG